MSNFKLVNTTKDDAADALLMTQPVIAAFPMGLKPSAQAMTETTFELKQQQKSGRSSAFKNKRVLKAERKNSAVSFTATSFEPAVAAKNQTQDFYLAVLPSVPEKRAKDNDDIYLLPVDTHYQFTQNLVGFTEKYGVCEDNQAIKGMTYMEKKRLLATDFGVLKAQRATMSLLNNKVDDDGVINKEGRGARAGAILERAKEMEAKAQDIRDKAKKDNSAAGKKAKYSIDAIISQELMQKIPYKDVYEALSYEDEEASEEALTQLLTPFAKISIWNAYEEFEVLETNREKKNLIRAHVFLDALIRLQRMTHQINRSVESLVETVFYTIDAETLQCILDEYTQVQMNTANRKKQADDEEEVQPIKFVKTKELQKSLMCTIISLGVQLARNQRLKASAVSRLLKKEVSELKNYFKEIGLNVETTTDSATNKPDLALFWSKSSTRKADDKLAAKEFEEVNMEKRARAKSQ